jgi:hypothetical protein
LGKGSNIHCAGWTEKDDGEGGSWMPKSKRPDREVRRATETQGSWKKHPNFGPALLISISVNTRLHLLLTVREGENILSYLPKQVK